jgi:inner membrane protein import complex subunit Tim44-like protein
MRLACALALLLVLAPAASLLEARPGGGQSYSGGSRSGGGSSGGGSSSGSSSSGSSSHSSSSSSRSSSSSGSSSSGGTEIHSLEDIPVFVWLFFGLMGLAAISIALQGMVSVFEKIEAVRDKAREWQTREARGASAALAKAAESPPEDRWHVVRQDDPDFSAILFEDFIHAAYATIHLARGRPAAMAALSPYLRARFGAQLEERPLPGHVESVLVAATRVERVIGLESTHRVVVEFESNVSYAATPPQAEYLKESWVFERRRGVRTRGWKGVRTFGCPACGGPMQATAENTCSWCGEPLEARRFDWAVTGGQIVDRQRVPPGLTGGVEERGTGAATVRQDGVAEALAALGADDPALSEAGLRARIETVFAALHSAWAAQELRPLRPFVSDALFNSLQYWVDAYRRQGLVNAVELARITKQELARVTRDRHFDAVTLRVWATGFEVTRSKDDGAVVVGSAERERPYTEYWTLIRGSGVRGAARTDATCPSCASPLDVNMAGSCTHCGAHVTSGEFDWVLSRIEQDDAYSG